MIAVTRCSWTTGVVLFLTSLSAAGDSPVVAINSDRTTAPLRRDELPEHGPRPARDAPALERRKVPVVFIQGVGGFVASWGQPSGLRRVSLCFLFFRGVSLGLRGVWGSGSAFVFCFFGGSAFFGRASIHRTETNARSKSCSRTSGGRTHGRDFWPLNADDSLIALAPRRWGTESPVVLHGQSSSQLSPGPQQIDDLGPEGRCQKALLISQNPIVISRPWLPAGATSRTPCEQP